MLAASADPLSRQGFAIFETVFCHLMPPFGSAFISCLLSLLDETTVIVSALQAEAVYRYRYRVVTMPGDLVSQPTAWQQGGKLPSSTGHRLESCGTARNEIKGDSEGERIFWDAISFKCIGRNHWKMIHSDKNQALDWYQTSLLQMPKLVDMQKLSAFLSQVVLPTLGTDKRQCQNSQCDGHALCFWRPFKLVGKDGYDYDCECQQFWMSPPWRRDIKIGTICVRRSFLFWLGPDGIAVCIGKMKSCQRKT
ncbi:unnamed protein product [Protopolystoma xenopodis]|uniref:Uncharacterized protein n=1 Tax=Protopolystoma xenopodis TaxID=117903 RepID=A0A3S5AUV0_9PLAT|nr:unnamed protein product [Protopolystoma xenopodis]